MERFHFPRAAFPAMAPREQEAAVGEGFTPRGEMTMLERLERAIDECLTAHVRRGDPDPLFRISTAEEVARAIIEAMREPTRAVVSEGWLAAHRVQTEDRCNHEMIRVCWCAMLDAILQN